jgi:Uma2 family endonuclease
MSLPASAPLFTIEEYLRREEKSAVKHEFHEGEILEMSGGSYEHSLITANIVGEMRVRLKGSPCKVLESNMRVRVKPTPRYVYPDASVICGPPQFDPQDPKRTTILNPRVIVEVLSESTEAYDRGEKFTRYREIASFEEYILVSQASPMVETFMRQADGTWSFAPWSGIEAVARVRMLQIEIPFSEIYAGIEFPARTVATE